MQQLAPQINLNFGFGSSYAAAPVRRPMMEIELAAVDANGALLGQTKTVLLVDSGADRTVLDSGLAGILGIDLSAVAPRQMGVAGGGVVQSWLSPNPILMLLCGKWVRVPVEFCHGQQPGLLGREGAFDALRLAFIHSVSLLVAAIHP